MDSIRNGIVFWIKRSIAYIAIRIHIALQGRRFDLYDGRVRNDPVKLGFLSPQVEKDLESPKKDSHLLKHEDDVTFYGVNSKSECLLVRIARGPNQTSNAWIYLKLADGETYSLIETHGFQQPSDRNEHIFSCGKLQMHYMSPMRKWRIFFCGMLKQTTGDNHDQKEAVFVKFVFLWKASSEVYDCTLDTNPEGFADALARSKWEVPFIPPTKKFSEAFNFYAQGGVVAGTVSISDGNDYDMYMFGERIRSLGESANMAGCKFTTVLGNIPKNGLTFHLSQASAPLLVKDAQCGFAIDPDGSLWPLKNLVTNINPFSVKKSGSPFKASFYADGQYEICGNMIEPIDIYSGQSWSGNVDLYFMEFTYKNKKGSGFILRGEVNKKLMHSETISIPRQIPAIVPLTVPFDDETSQFGEISGGKGSSLGMLTLMSKEEKSFIVPKGIILTTAAYREFLTPEILGAVKDMENVAYGNSKGDLITACNKVATIVENTPFSKRIRRSVIEALKEVFKNEMNHTRFAIRSSATGEDTAAISAAGQMDTFLGVKDLEQIFSTVKKCWASQFGHIAVEYKRRHGQVLNSPMAVVIQEMVACEVSGVMFTCDPVTNNPSYITITANYGLGETVVSGSIEPDTFTIKRNNIEELEIESIVLGSKHQKIVMQESGGTIVEDIGEESKKESCLSKDSVIKLAELGIAIEKYFKSSRDIEWGILNEKIYVLQSRPITNEATATDDEIEHEFDSPLRCENVYNTVANVGEVFPGATTPLTFDFFTKFFSCALQKRALEKGFIDNFCKGRYFQSILLAYSNHIMVPVVELITRFGLDTPASKGYMISIFGRILDEPDLINYTREKVKEGAKPSWALKLRYFWDLLFFDFQIPKVWKKIFNYHMGFMKYETASETFDAMMKACCDLDDAAAMHMECTEVASNWNMIVLSILCQSNNSIDTNMYCKFARFLSTSSKVESANVPHAMKEVADQIVKDIAVEKFKSMPVEECEEWLQSSSTSSGQKFREFLTRHGHRCIKEYDMNSDPWAMDPKMLVKVLQSLVGFDKKETKPEDDSIDKIISHLNVPLSFLSKLILKFAVFYCRKGVIAREISKSVFVKSLDQWRKGFRRLEKQMVSEGRLPEEHLISFFTLEELDDFLKTRSPTILTRALHRKKLQSILDKYEFPEIMKGLPKPINIQDESSDRYEFVADLSMQGIPVSQGVTKGYARVAMTLDQAADLKPGEILITNSTDIGWSPYFPIISGVVTELGGLISHGAVISREYGLPCIVGLHGVTKKFTTGDYVLLDGKKGILQRLPKPAE